VIDAQAEAAMHDTTLTLSCVAFLRIS